MSSEAWKSGSRPNNSARERTYERAARADSALQIAHAGLACVRVDQLFQRAVFEFDPRLFQTLFRELLRNQELASDAQLLEMRIAGEGDDLHAVLERRRDRVRHVGRGD